MQKFKFVFYNLYLYLIIKNIFEFVNIIESIQKNENFNIEYNKFNKLFKNEIIYIIKFEKKNKKKYRRYKSRLKIKKNFVENKF